MVCGFLTQDLAYLSIFLCNVVKVINIVIHSNADWANTKQV